MIKYTFLFLFIIPFPVFSYSQKEGKYDEFRTGTFTYLDKGEGVLVIRTKKTQIEIYPDGESKLINKIKWINDSTYMLTFKKSINADGCLVKGDRMKIEFLSKDGNQYKCRYTSSACGKGEVTMKKVD
ncbi:MAG: hypothetical protein COA38_14340 [Fluviicola sp.]|nr:MAG: hypothetical protein COA38_14340 [Fluviicola sp.]